jgi:hypothetical protein
MASVCVAANREDEYKLAIEQYQGNQRKFIIDCWRMLDSARLSASIGYFAWGRMNSHLNPDGQAAPEAIAQFNSTAVAN